MKCTVFFAALALMVQLAGAQATSGRSSGGAGGSGGSGGGGIGGGGGFGGGTPNEVILNNAAAANSVAAKWLLLTGDGTTRPTEKGAYIGVGVTSVPPVVRDQLKLQRGVGLVANYIEKDSPAQSAGVHENDILIKLDDQLLINPQQFAVLVRMHKPGDTIKLTLIHEAKTTELNVKPVERDLAALEETGGGSPARSYEQIRRLLNGASGTAVPYNYATSPFGGGGSFQMESSDDQNNYSVSRYNGNTEVTARDNKDGKVIFSGLVNTDEQMKKVPESIRPKVEKLRNWPTRFPASMPVKTFKVLPPSTGGPSGAPDAPLFAPADRNRRLPT